MKQLMLMRHGEAQNSEAGKSDRQRNLTLKGREDVIHLHATLQAEELMPHYAISSDAVRTHMTLRYITGDDFEGLAELTPALYNAPADAILNTIRMLDNQYDRVLVVAHNPGIHLAVISLMDVSYPPEFQDTIGNQYNPGTLAILECPIDHWSDLAIHKNKLTRLFIPD